MDPDYVVLLNPETKVKILQVDNSIWNSEGSHLIFGGNFIINCKNRKQEILNFKHFPPYASII